MQSRPWSATGAGGFEVLIANCKLQIISLYNLFTSPFIILKEKHLELGQVPSSRKVGLAQKALE